MLFALPEFETFERYWKLAGEEASLCDGKLEYCSWMDPRAWVDYRYLGTKKANTKYCKQGLVFVSSDSYGFAVGTYKSNKRHGLFINVQDEKKNAKKKNKSKLKVTGTFEKDDDNEQDSTTFQSPVKGTKIDAGLPE